MDETERDFLWLEDLQSERSLKWVQEQNRRTLERYTETSLYESLHDDALRTLAIQPRVPQSIHAGQVYFLDQTSKHPRGLWKRTSVENFGSLTDAPELLLDLDALSASEGKQWYFHHFRISPNSKRCLLALADGGLDKAVIREFDFETKQFPPGGLSLPEAKSVASWYDDDSIVIGGYTPELRNKIGYTRVLKLWKRGESIDNAQTIFEGKQESLSVYGYRKPGEPFFIADFTGWQENVLYTYEKETSKLQRVYLPSVNSSNNLYDGLAFTAFDDFGPYPAGTILWISLEDAMKDGGLERFQLVAKLDSQRPIDAFDDDGRGLFIQHLENVVHKLEYVERVDGEWKTRKLSTPPMSSIRRTITDEVTKKFYFVNESFIHPLSVYEVQPDFSTKLIHKNTMGFAGEFETKQHFATSPDGTRVPYFVVHKKNLNLTAPLPTLMTAYGGFLASQVPYYQSLMGKLWLERGGIFVLANIRGGAEYGPEWHKAALRENRQRCYDDFIAVSEDLMKRGYTKPDKFAITGRSNGGLLVGAVSMQRPDLYAAVLCGVPLLDMLRYHLLPPGGSWMHEYGDPEDPAIRDVILKYSPYQNIHGDKKYPEIFFYTALSDDRVHPSHARRMAAKMQELGHAALFYEEGEGGHAGGSIETKARGEALRFTYLWEKLSSSPRN